MKFSLGIRRNIKLSYYRFIKQEKRRGLQRNLQTVDKKQQDTLTPADYLRNHSTFVFLKYFKILKVINMRGALRYA